MKYLAQTDHALVLRTDFSDDAAWEAICGAIEEPVGEFRAYVAFVNDREFEGVTADRLASLIAPGAYRSFVFIVDRLTHSHPDHPILVVDC